MGTKMRLDCHNGISAGSLTYLTRISSKKNDWRM